MQNFWRILQYAKPYKFQIIMAVIFNILMVLFSVFSILMLIPVLKFILENTTTIVTEPVPWTGLSNLKDWATSLLDRKMSMAIAESGQWLVLKWVLGVGAVMFVVKNLTRYIAAIFMVYVKNGVSRDLRQTIHNHVLELPMAAIVSRRKGDLITRMTADALEVQAAMLGSIQRIIQDPLMVLLTLGSMMILSPQLTLFALIFIPIVGIIISSIGNTLKKSSALLREETGRMVSYFEEHINGLSVIKSYVAEKSASARFNLANSKVFRYANSMMYRNALASPMSEALGSLIIIGIMAYGGYLIINEGKLEPEEFLAFIGLFYQIIAPIKNLGKATADIKKGEASAARIFEIIDAPNPLADKLDAVDLDAFRNEIVFDNVSFAYNEDQVVKNFNLTIPKGSTVALVGQSGSGKSTIASLINRFYDVSEGEIRIDGKSVKDIRKSALRGAIGFISQEAILFNGSVAENIRFGMHDKSNQEIEQAAAYANAAIFIDELEGTYDYNIGDQGRKLSGGQRQRLTIARAILKNPPIMVLDEATSALDSESEKLVQDAIDKIMEGRTALIIAHRLSTVQHADKIVVMKDGRIIEEGNHESLIQKQGEYYNLVKLQEI